MREKLKKMKYAEVKKMVLPDAEYFKYFDAWEHLVADFHDLPGIFPGIGDGGKRSDAVQASVYDAQLAELLGERFGQKELVRNRRKADRKEKERNPRYIKRNGEKFDRNVWYEGSKVFHWEEDLRMPERRANSKAESEERDYAVELRNRDDALAEHSDYLDMAIDHAEKLEYWRNKKSSVEYWELMIDEVSRQIIYEQNRVNELMRIADTIMEGECY